MGTKVAVGMSGGVDSAAAALLLQEMGYEVEGVYLHLWGEGDSADARAVCDALGIPLAVLDVRAAFRAAVIDPFADEYTAGRTPNPCVRCNPAIKEGMLARWADERGIPLIATGHYAQRILGQGGRYAIKQAAYLEKDQSYALCMLSPALVDRFLLPLGSMNKAQVRALVEQAGLPVAHKAESQDICFVPDGDYVGFLEKLRPGQNPPGRFRMDGVDLGPHRGLWHYTIGQRKGLGIAVGKPIFVQRIDRETGDVILAEEGALYAKTLTTKAVNWMDRDSFTGPEEFMVKTRYSAKPVKATVLLGEENNVTVVFETPQRAVTPGQSAALYQNGILCGGGVIDSAG